LRELIQTTLVTKHVRNVGTAAAPIWEREYRPVEPDEQVIRTMITAPPGGFAGSTFFTPGRSFAKIPALDLAGG
jgi:hypothetical protein